MASYAGSALYLAWVNTAGGTTVLSGDFRSFSFDPSVNLIDGTAGADTTRERIVGTKDFTWTAGLVAQASGTVLLAAMAEGSKGTLLAGPEGNTAGQLKIVFPSILNGPRWNQPFDNVVEITVSGVANGARSETTW